MNESKTQPVGLFIGVAAAIIFLSIGIAVWVEGARYGWSRDARIMIELGLFSALLLAILFAKYLEAVLLVVASSKAARWFVRYDSRNQASSSHHAGLNEHDEHSDRADTLRGILEHRHGRHWRYGDRWILIAGHEAQVKRLAPDLAEKGYAVTASAVLLYATQTTSTLDVGWLDQIRRMRRRRPVDAIVAVTRDRGVNQAPAEADDVAQRLSRHARALHWAAPAYLLHVTDFGSESGSDSPMPDEAIGLTWSNARVTSNEIDLSLQGLADHLADAGVIRVASNVADRYPAALSQNLASLQRSLSEVVSRVAQSRFCTHAVHGLLFMPLYKERDPVASNAGEAAGSDRAQPQADKTGKAGETVEADFPPFPTIWQTIATHSHKIRGRRVGFSLSTTAAWITTAALALWIAGTVTSGFTNSATIRTAEDTITKLTKRSTTRDQTETALTLDALDKQIDTLEAHARDRAPWRARFGLNRDIAILDALQSAHESAARYILADPLRRKLEDRLRQLASLSDSEIASGGNAQVQAAYDTLKTYLMLAKPELANAAFLTPQLIATGIPVRPHDSTLAPGTWDDLRRHLLAFYATHLTDRRQGAKPTPPITADLALVASTRQTIIAVRGIQNSTDAIYQQILDDARPKYPPVSLATLLGDAAQQAPAQAQTQAQSYSGAGGTTSRGLFGTTATIPGIFTRAAWDERISKAIDDASENRDAKADWVLSDTNGHTSSSPSTLKADLSKRYFDDYARAWGVFLNSLRWQPASTLSGTVDQLNLLGDPQRSPLVALMNVIVYQANAGATSQSLSDTLIRKAQHLVGADEPSKNTSFSGAISPSNDPRSQLGQVGPLGQLAQLTPAAASLAATFAPILRLTGSDPLSMRQPTDNKAVAQLATTGDLSVARYLERVTAMRLKAQQMVASADPDAMSRVAAQAVLQGKTSDIADSRDYASRVAASLGEQWAGFGSLFEAPMDQTWQVVVAPAASSLNDIWRSAIVSDWNRSFAGRYPFADSDNDASLPEMARFMRTDNGMIAQFVTTQLAGVVERQGDRWVAAQGANHGALTLDPNFLAALNRLTRVSTVLFPSGDAHVRYELRAVPTPGITDIRFALSGRELHYFNQKEEWTPFEWPGQSLENLSHIEWQTEQGGLRSALDTQGRFGLIRLLERATVSQQDNARHLLSWTPDQSEGIALRVQLRSEAGAGPLDVLALRHFTLPACIFATNSRNATSAANATSATGATSVSSATGASSTRKGAATIASAINPPPLPAEAIAAARHAATPLPSGRFTPEEAQ
jgi:type VI secretion system protein ImpL